MSKTKNNFSSFLIFSGLIYLSACSPSVGIQVLQPAQLVIPDHVNTIAIIDRSKPSSGWATAALNLLNDNALFQDRNGRVKAVEGLTKTLTQTPRFAVKSTTVELNGSETGTSMLAPIDWRDIERICQDYKVDAVAAIEMFEPRNDIRITKGEVTEKKDGKEIKRTEFTANRMMNLRFGWRLYDPQSRQVLDEYVITKNATHTGKGETEKSARTNLSSGTTCVEDLSLQAGNEYGKRIAPTWITVHRTYFSSGDGVFKEPMKQAVRDVETAQWLKAEDIWAPIAAQKDDKKSAGKATYNLALANEVLGKLETALVFANSAYSDYAVSEAKDYIEILKQRISDSDRLKTQLNQKL